MIANVAEDLVEVLGAVGSGVAALKHQDCGYAILQQQLGVICLPGGFRRSAPPGVPCTARLITAQLPLLSKLST